MYIMQGGGYLVIFDESSPYWWLSARPQYLQCVKYGDAAVFNKVIDL